MARKHQPFTAVRLAFVTLLTLVASLLLARSAQAQGIVQGGRLPAGQVVEGDAFIGGTDVVVDGTVTGDLFAAGNTVAINGTVEGSVFAAGRVVLIDGQVNGSSYVIGRTVDAGPKSVISRTLRAISVDLFTRAGSRVEQDLAGLSLRGRLSGDVAGDLRAIFGALNVTGPVNSGQAADSPADASTGLPGDRPASQNSNQNRVGLISLIRWSSPGSDEGRTASLTPARQEGEDQGDEREGGFDAGRFALGRLREFVILILIGGLAVWIFPALFGIWADQSWRKPLPSAGWGLIVAVFGLVVGLIIGLLIFVLGLFLYNINFDSLAVILWAGGLAGLGLAFTFFFVTIFYLTKVIVSYEVARQILKQSAPERSPRPFWIMLLGVFLYVLLTSIPYLGWVIGFVATLIGLGAIWIVARQGRQPSGEEGEVSELAMPVETA